MKKELIIIGAGGYAKSVLDSFDPQQYDFRAFWNERPDKEEHFGYPSLPIAWKTFSTRELQLLHRHRKRSKAKDLVR